MEVLISVDIEGVAGVATPEPTEPGHADYSRFRRFMTAEANAAIAGALAGGAKRIIVNDSHGPATNILIEDLNPCAELISGSLKSLNMVQGVSRSTAAVLLIGYHAASGTGSAALSHTNSSLAISQTRLNGNPVGEVGINAALVGAFGVPVALVTGDTAATEEARSLLGDLETVTVKEGITWNAARCLHPLTVQERIREAAERAVRRIPRPWTLSAPITVEVAFLAPCHADVAELVPGSRRIDGRTLAWTGDDMLEVHRAYWAMVQLTNTVHYG